MSRFRVARFVAALAVGFLLGPAAVLAYSPDGEELAFLDLINAYRAENGLGPLALQDELGDAAEFHSQDMATADYFAHTLSDGTSAGENISNFGYSGGTWGENIAAGMETAAEALYYWQNSPGHNATMLDPNYTEIGIGRFYGDGSYYGWYWTTTFGGGEGAPVDGAEIAAADLPATLNGEPIVSGDGVVTTVNGVPIESNGQIVNADGEVITTIIGETGAAPIETTTTVAEAPSVTEGVVAEPVAEAAPAEAAPVDTTQTTAAQEVAPAETAPVEAAPAAAAPADQGSAELAQEVIEPPTINGVPVESGDYTVDGGVVRDAGGNSRGTANADGPTIIEGDINGSGTYTADGGYNTGALAPPAAPAAPESTTTTTTTTDGTGTVTTTTTINGITMEDGTSTEYGNAQGEGATAAPGNVTYGN